MKPILRSAIIGLGESAQRILLPGLSTLPGIEIVAACDLDAEKRQSVAALWKIPNLYSSPEEMLAKEQPGIFIISTPPQTHHSLALLGLNQGAHIYCEKPFMESVEDADEVIALARERNLFVEVNSQYYQMPIFAEARKLLEDDKIGRLYHIEMWQHMYLKPEHESGWKAALQPQRNLYDFGTHIVDLMCRFFDAYPEAVTARIPRALPGVEADLCILMRLDFPDDRVGNIVLNRVSFAPKKYLEMRLDGEQAALRASYGGVANLELGWNSELSRPRINFSLTKGGELRLEHSGSSKSVVKQAADSISTASRAHFTQFVDAIRTGENSTKAATHAREILRVVLAGYQSADRNGELVKL